MKGFIVSLSFLSCISLGVSRLLAKEKFVRTKPHVNIGTSICRVENCESRSCKITLDFTETPLGRGMNRRDKATLLNELLNADLIEEATDDEKSRHLYIQQSVGRGARQNVVTLQFLMADDDVGTRTPDEFLVDCDINGDIVSERLQDLQASLSERDGYFKGVTVRSP